MKVVVLHPTGNKNVRAVISGLDKAGMLIEFNTTIAVNENSSLLNFLPKNLKQEILRRNYSFINPSQIVSFPLIEIARMLFTKLKLTWFYRAEAGWFSIDAVYNKLDSNVATRIKNASKDQIDGVYAYEDGALACFTAAKKLGIKCIYELPIAYWKTGRDLMQDEALRNPKWEITLGGGTRDSLSKLDRKTRELELADIVIVSSSFVKDSLPDWANSKKIIMSPFGSPATAEIASVQLGSAVNPGAKLRVLFAGSMGQRKGLCDLFDAFKLLNRNDIELVVMGSLLAPMEFYEIRS